MDLIFLLSGFYTLIYFYSSLMWMQWSCDIYHVLVILQCYYLYYAWFYEAYPGASLFCEIKFQSKFLSIFFANYDRYSRVSPESVSEARTERVRQSRSQVTSRSRRLESGERESGHTGEWRGDHRSWTQPSLKHIVTLIVIPTSKDTVCWGKVKDCDSTKRIQLCFDGGI